MIIDFEKLQGDVERLSGDQVITFEDSFGKRSRANCHIDLTIERHGDAYHVEGQTAGSFTTSCHKCLEAVTFEVNPSFKLLIQRGGERWDDEETEDEYLYVPEGETEVSIEQQIYENVIVNIPIRIVCSEECRGLCPTCGANLNNSTCACKPAVDARWDALRELKKRSSG